MKELVDKKSFKDVFICGNKRSWDETDYCHNFKMKSDKREILEKKLVIDRNRRNISYI